MLLRRGRSSRRRPWRWSAQAPPAAGARRPPPARPGPPAVVSADLDVDRVATMSAINGVGALDWLHWPAEKVSLTFRGSLLDHTPRGADGAADNPVSVLAFTTTGDRVQCVTDPRERKWALRSWRGTSSEGLLAGCS